MTKHILIVVYVAVVLAISGFAKADTVRQAQVDSVQFDMQTGVLTVHGTLSNPCTLKPMLVIDGIDQTNKVINIEVSTLVRSEICVEMLGGSYDATLDLKELPLKEGEIYTLKIAGYDDEMHRNTLEYIPHHSDANLEAYKVDKRELKGYLVAVENPVDGKNFTTGFVLQSGDQEIPVVSPDIDLNRFKNYQVWLGGYVINMAKLNGGNVDALATSGQAQMVIVPVSISH
jgi:hypothetical protein